MIKHLKECTDQEKLDLFLDGVSYAMYSAGCARENYEKYKKDELDDASDYKLKEAQVLDVLVKLGYSLDELGTYFYKDVVYSVIEELKGVAEEDRANKHEELLAQLSNAYSNFYSFIARDELEMSMTAFHLYIQKAICERKSEQDPEIITAQIFGDEKQELNYGEAALKIADYTLHEPSQKVDLASKPIIKQLSNVRQDVKLKKVY